MLFPVARQHVNDIDYNYNAIIDKIILRVMVRLSITFSNFRYWLFCEDYRKSRTLGREIHLAVRALK